MRDIQADREFKDHVATMERVVVDGVPMIFIAWRKPGDCCFAMEFVIHKGVITVHGDLGHAVYRWPDSRCTENLGLWANLGFDYFAGKCEAHENGRRARDWSFDEFKAQLQNELSELEDEQRHLSKEHMDELLENARDAIDLEIWLRGLCRHDEWFWDVFGEPGEAEWHVLTMGHVPDRRMLLHWQGLVLACRALLVEMENTTLASAET